MAISDKIEQHVQNALNAVKLGAPFLVSVERLLASLGYTKQQGDDWLMGYCEQQVVEEIQNACNVVHIPLGLRQTAVGLAVAEFLLAKKGMGCLNIGELNFEPALKQIQEGDTTMVWDVTATPEKRLDSFIDHLLSNRGQFASYRRVKW